MGLGRAPHEPWFVQRLINVCERRGRQRVDVVRKRALVELVAHDWRNASCAQHVGGVPHRTAHERQRIHALLVDVEREEGVHGRADLRAGAFARGDRGGMQLRTGRRGRPVPPAGGHRSHHPRRQRGLDRVRQSPAVHGEVGVGLHHGNAATMPQRIEPGPGQESVWDYPRPPALEPTTSLLRVEFQGAVIAETTKAYRVLETSQPPAYYFPPGDVAMDHLVASAHRTFCEWKGQAHYYSVVVDGMEAVDAVWSYSSPTDRFLPIKDYLAFYPQRMSACFVDGERVQANEGGFYGGWITSKIVGPFKGGPGSAGW
jgi:uncharacterized protein (DUF427 family)